MKIDPTQLNGQSGNKDYYDYSNQAEAAVIQAINSAFDTNKFVHISTDCVSHGDFYLDDELGDIKIRSGTDFCIEVSQTKHGREVNGWFIEYYEMNGKMKWIIFINPGYSNNYGEVYKVRLVPFQDIVNCISKCKSDPVSLGNGSTVYFVNPKHLPNDGWIGHFSKTDDGLIDTDDFYKNPNIQF